jgi:hypothetical protein
MTDGNMTSARLKLGERLSMLATIKETRELTHYHSILTFI